MLTLITSDLILHSWFFFEMHYKEFTFNTLKLKYVIAVKNTFLMNPYILDYAILFH